MPEIFALLAQLEVAVSEVTPIYTVPTATQAVIKHMKIVNHDTVSHTIELWQGGTANVNVILPALTLQGGEWAEFDGAMAAAAADVLHARADAANVLTLSVYGLEIS